ncbi:MAG TPA: TlyA family RNA methyltransferase [Candidatus Polarisedimenticolaceae bacterium]|nr:TlyA family RNA methyltransferase [Candidatus Polarisedimenticolaceae bacterium]
MSGRVRLDVLLVERGLAPTRAKAQAMLLAGLVTTGERRLDKPGALVPRDLPLAVAPGRRYVGRGAGKLAPALVRFGVDAAGRAALDVGASTGGFTQVLLEAGASAVMALDVGRGQLDWSLRNDPRVVVVDGVNARFLTPSLLPSVPSLAVIDVSFISLRQVLKGVCACLAPGADVIALVKPQFEVGRERVGKHGIVSDKAAWDDVLVSLTGFAREHGLGPRAIARSAVRGATGNVEFFLHLRPGGGPAAAELLDADRRAAVDGEEA